MKKYTIAIDGVAGSGKGTTAKGVAKALGYKYIDTGSMYRALARYLLDQKITLKPDTIITALQNISIDLGQNESGPTISVNGHDITKHIRTTKVSNIIGSFVHIPKVRTRMVNQQKKLGHGGGVVMEGRDIGSVVLPDADVKVFLTADLTIRAQRRFTEQVKVYPTLTLAEVKRNLEQRDANDRKQLQVLFDKFPDSVVTIDTTHCSIDEQIQQIVGLVG